MNSFWRDLQFGLRALRKHSTVTVVAVLSLALAIAGNMLVFSLINGLLYRPMPYADPDRIVVLAESLLEEPWGGIAPVSAANFSDWQEQQQAFSTMALFRPSPGRWGRGETRQLVRGAEVSREFFSLLGVVPALGRLFSAERGADDAATLVLSHAFWAEHYASDSSIIGQVIPWNGEAHTVIGVLPEDFEFLDPGVRLWSLLDLEQTTDRRLRDAYGLARLSPGVSEEQALAELTVIAERLRELYPDANRGFRVDLLNLRHQIPDQQKRRLMALLQGALIFVLLIACSNVANLLLARGQTRSSEIALRVCLGASRGRLFRQLLTESLLLSSLAGLAGLAIGTLGILGMGRILSTQMPKFYAPIVDLKVLAFTVGVTILAALTFGLLPAWRSHRAQAMEVLKDASGVGPPVRRRIWSQGLVVAEITLALILLGGAAVLIRSFLDMQDVDPGFETAHLLTAQVRLPDEGDGLESWVHQEEALEAELARLPGVRSVAGSDKIPRGPSIQAVPFKVDGHAVAAQDAQPRALRLSVGSEFIDTLGISIRRGRFFNDLDQAGSEPIAVINQHLATRFWPDEQPVGQWITVGGESRRIVGVVANVLHGFLISDAVRSAIYIPWQQDPTPVLSLVLRTEGDPGTMIETIRRTIATVDSRILIQDLRRLDAYEDQFFAGTDIFVKLLGAFGSLALLLAACGIYGVLTYSVAQRKREIGVRLALGARRVEVLSMVTRQGLRLTVLGILIGLPGVWAISRVVASAVSGAASIDPLALIMVAIGLLVVAALASFLPARHAASTDPIEVLRSE